MNRDIRRITNRARWFRSIKPGVVSEGQFRSSKIFKSLSVQLTDYNRTVGREKGIFIHANYLPAESVVILVGVTLEEREKELADASLKNAWRKLIERRDK